MPFFYNNKRTSNNSNLFSFYFTYRSHNNITIGVTIQEYLYTTIYLLITNSNSALVTTLSSFAGLSFVLCVVNSYYIKITIN